MSESAGRITRILIEGLFSPDAAPIDIQMRLDDRVTVLHGRNGSGKTITLSLLASIGAGRFHELTRVPFDRLRIELTDGSYVELVQRPREPAASLTGNAAEVVYLHFLFGDGHPIAAPSTDAGILPATPLRRPKVFARIGRQRGYIDLETLDLGGDPADDPRKWADLGRLKTFCERLPPIKLIKTDRLVATIEPPPPELRAELSRDPYWHAERVQLMVERLSEDIREHVQAADKVYRQTSTQLDASLTQRLVDPTSESDVSIDQLRTRYATLRAQEERLRGLGLIKEAAAPVKGESFSEKNRHVLAIILEDNEKKLEPFRRLADRAERLLDTLNRKLYPKSVRLDVESGYHVTGADGRPLELSALSSGEQHEFVLLHELLFEVEAGSLILIDEPELSLHVTWQEQFLPDLLGIAELSDIDFILATHSPYIIGDRHDLMVRLGEPVDVDA